eukprot:TRINITY_DN4486_c0_g1_i2.p1 TRINITY_DN4486_c0_g1~~TRINITY_DN4486_c0_g1_i2.p1  ORF type:complete len:248 (+),score=62.85 TRINITY_DN4486_c0_g1_i2:433-1176(+)
MERREQLAGVGNATGAYKMVIKYLGGVPEVLLEFIRKINDHNGPMEELRIKYGPYLYFLMRFLNTLQILIALFVHMIINEKKKPKLAILQAASDSVALFQKELEAYFELMLEILEKSPFFISKDQADARSSKPKEVVVKSLHEEVVAVNANDTVTWEFATASKDINFELHFKSSDESAKEKEIVARSRIESHLRPHRGEAKAESAGTFRFAWDNSYSYFSKKTLKYTIKTQTEQKEEKEEEEEVTKQ